MPPRWSRRGWGDQAAVCAIADVLSGSPSGRLPRPPGTGWGTRLGDNLSYLNAV